MENEENFLEERYQFLISEYYATGEGRTLAILITAAYPHHDDYSDESKNKSYTTEEGKFHFVMPTLKEGVTAKTIAKREFTEKFGYHLAIGVKFITRKELLAELGAYLPEIVRHFLSSDQDDAGNFNYFSKYHVNYS